MELANRLFFRLYQCANMLHKTGSRAVEDEGLTTQQWAVLGALSRDEAQRGMSIGEPGALPDGEPAEPVGPDRPHGARRPPRHRARRPRPPLAPGDDDAVGPPGVAGASPSRRSTPTTSRSLDRFSINDVTHTLHYLLKMLENMQRLDGALAPGEPAAD